MPHHRENDSEHGTRRCHALERMIVVSPSPMALDSGDTDEFTFTQAGDFACFCGVRPHRRRKIAVPA